MAKKKIAIITPSLSTGGLERVAGNLSTLLSEKYEVSLIVFKLGNTKKYNFSGKLFALNIDLYKRNVLLRFINVIKASYYLRKIKELRFVAFISMGELANIPNIISGGFDNILTIHENKVYASEDFQKKIVNIIIRYLYRSYHVKKIITVSEEIKEDLVKFFKLPKSKVEFIYNPFDINLIVKKSNVPLNKYSNLFKNNCIIINVARLSYPKGQWYLLRIFRELRYHIDCKLIILGDGELKGFLIELSKKLGLRTFSIWENEELSVNFDVYFLGYQDNPYNFIKNSTIFVSTSLWEGLPSVIVEALATGQVVVHSNCKSGPLEILSPGVDFNSVDRNIVLYGEYGVLMPIFDKKMLTIEPLTETEFKWVKSLLYILKNHELLSKYRKNSIIRAIDFDFSRISADWERTISERQKRNNISKF